MHFSTDVNFSVRYGKSIGTKSYDFYNLKIKLNELDDTQKRELFSNSVHDIISNDILLCIWLYYTDYQQFLTEFKTYILTIDNSELDLIINSTIHLQNVMDNFWLESNDNTLKTNYDPVLAKKNYIERVEKNGFKYKEKENYDGFQLLLKNADYKFKNENLYTQYFKFTQNLKYAHIDDILQMRTEEEWKILYSIRYIYKNVVNSLLDKNIDDKNRIELYKKKQKLELYLMSYQETVEGLEWFNPYSTKSIENIEYFPRETSKPTHKYAYSNYYDLENIAQQIFDDMVNIRNQNKIKLQNEFTKKIENIKNMLEQKNKRIHNIANFIYYTIRISAVLGVSAILYSYFYM